jgi:hypothetical protein
MRNPIDPMKFLGMLADLASIALLLAQTIHQLLPGVSEQYAAWLMVGAGLGLLWLLGRLSYGAHIPDSGWFLGPQWLWRFIYNRVGVQRGASYSPSRASRIAIVSDKSHETLANDLVSRLTGHNAQARSVLIDADPTMLPTAKLAGELESSDAVYVLWSDTMQDTAGLAETLIVWATANSAKPLLVVNFLTAGEYNLTFPALAQSEVHNGLPLLLTRAIDRAQDWRDQATMMRRLAFIGMFSAVVLGVAFYLTFQEYRNSEALLVWNEPAFLNLQAALERFHGDEDRDRGRTSGWMQRTDTAFGPLSSAAVFVESKISEWFVIPAASRPQVSFWRRMHVRRADSLPGTPTRTMLVQVAWNGDRAATIFGDVDTTIIGAAFADPELYLVWFPKAKRKELAAWDTDLADAGNYVGPDSLLIFRSHRPGRYGHLDSDPTRLGLLCYAQASRDRHVVSGISIDMRSSPLQLKTKPLAHLLQLTLAFVNTIPDDMLLSPQVKESLRKNALEVVPCGGELRTEAHAPGANAAIQPHQERRSRRSASLVRGSR